MDYFELVPAGAAGIFVGRHTAESKVVRELVLIDIRGAHVKKILQGFLGLALLGYASMIAGTSIAAANTLTNSSPSSGAVLATAPNAVSVTGTSPLSDQGSSLSVTDPSGKQVDDGSLTISDTTAVIGLKPLTAPGVYTVTYNLVSPSDVPLQGSYTFLFNAPAAISSPTPTPTQSISSLPAVKANHTVDIIVIILMVFAIFVGLFLLWYARMLIRESQARKRKSRSKNKVRTGRSKDSNDE